MIRVRAPATSANLGAGFDVFGLALKEPFDEIRVEESDEIEIRLSGLKEGVPEGRGNVAYKIAEELGVTARIEIKKGIRSASGLGSSAATSAGVTVALNELYSLGLSREEMIDISARGEEMISGSYHADNVSAAILGYFTVVRGRGRNLRAISIPLKLKVAVCLPEIRVATFQARRSLPEFISLEEHREDLSSAVMMIYEALRGNAEKFGELMNRGIAERLRKKFIPFYDEVKRAALESGAHGVTISGSGPAIIAVLSEDSSGVERAMKEVFERNGISCECFLTESGEGARILEE
ncbi:MAG: homoserine kinase [Archaeoglobi archaeon]|nr:homoserine kinase [Candidatus Mnemosynella bozhongmuii]